MAFESEYKQPRSGFTLFLIIAICIAFAAVWAYVFFAQKPRVADGAIDSITAVPLHSEYREGGSAADGVGGGYAKTDEMLVWVRFHMTNLTKDTPLYETRQEATLTNLHGEQDTADAQNELQVSQVRTIQGIPQVQGALLPSVLMLAPGASAQGLALFVYPMTKADWDHRREFSVTISFQMQHSLALKDPHPPVEDMMPKIGK